MSSLRPDARVRGVTATVRAGGPPPEDELDRALYLARHPAPDQPPDPHALDALAIYDGPYRHVLDALLLVGAPEDEICLGLELPPEVYRIYTRGCFDRAVFRNGFALRQYVRDLRDDGTEEFKSYDLALTEGYEALLDRYRVTEWPDLDPKRAVMRLAREFLLRSREHRNLRLTNPVARESLKAARAAMDACAQLHAMTGQKSKDASAVEELRIALQPRELTQPADSPEIVVAELVRTGPAKPD